MSHSHRACAARSPARVIPLLIVAGALNLAPTSAADPLIDGLERDLAAAQVVRERQRFDTLAEHRDAAAHQRMPDTMYASTPTPILAAGELACPAPHTAPGHMLLHRPFDRATAVGIRATTSAATAGANFVATESRAERNDAPIDLRSVGDFKVTAAAAADNSGHPVYLFPAAAEPARQGFVRVINHSSSAGTVDIVPTDDSGRVFDTLTLDIAADQTIHFNSDDLENGNADKGLTGATGAGQGDWRLDFTSNLDVEVLAYIRTTDGFLTAMNDIAPVTDDVHRIAIFNPGSNQSQVSWLRLVNPGTDTAAITIRGTDDAGMAGASTVTLTLDAGTATELSAAQLENGGSGFTGMLGNGAGKWRLEVESAQPLVAISLLESPTDHLTNLSTVAPAPVDSIHAVPLFPSAADSSSRQGFVRVINRSANAGDVTITAFDESTRTYDTINLSIAANEVVHFNSDDLEQGNTDKGLSGGVGAGEGDWRLELTSGLDIEVLSYIRTADGFLTAMHDGAPSAANVHRVAILNPGSNRQQESLLRIINPGDTPAAVTITGIDGDGAPGAGDIDLGIAAGATLTIGAWDLESGTADFTGALGDGAAKWQLSLTTDQPLIVMSLMRSPTGHLTNLSTAPGRGVGATGDAVDFTAVSAIVQSKCINCHVEGGVSGHTRLVFVSSNDPDHLAKNQAMFEALLDEEDADYVLNKIQGVSHGGGIQVAAGSDEFADMEAFLTSLGEDVVGSGISAANLFDGVQLETPRDTLRRAAIVFAGRVPTAEEYAAVDSGDEAALRTAVRGLMQGQGFHDFLIRGANDRLLTDREEFVIDPGDGYFVAYNQANHERYVAAMENESDERPFGAYFDWRQSVDYGLIRAPLELVAHVVENDRPYTEILTADYIMANPLAAEAYGAATTFDDATDVEEFVPSEIESYYRNCEGREFEFVEDLGWVVTDPGPCATDYPHAGILNTTAFLTRYPTTATNRNRARSRWTYYHFLGLDIEQSAPRTTDPDALSDTNNPTLYNPNCTVCHTVMDPVAGTFQNYDERGRYKSRYGGLDSLDNFYKFRPTGSEHEVTIDASATVPHVIAASGWMPAGSREIGFQTINQRDGAGTNLHLDYLTVSNELGEVVSHIELEDLGQRNWDGVSAEVCCGTFIVPVDVPADGTYSVEVAAWVGYQDPEIEGQPGRLLISIGGPFYQPGDTWYRDMREPGFDGVLTQDSEASSAWLAERAVADPRFAEATVRFWWPTVMGTDIARPPAEGDVDFDGRLVASNAQAETVTALAADFRTGIAGGSPHNLKGLLVEIALTPWFRAASVVDDDPVRLVALADAGARRLLTPEELARKTADVTGFHWNSFMTWVRLVDAEDWTSAEAGYGLLYGGIDSDGVTERARDLTPVMVGVAKRLAAATSCPTVMKEFYLLDDADRRLFGGFDHTRVPVTPSGSANVRAKLVELHETLLGVSVADDSPDVQAAFDLFYEVWERQRTATDELDFRQIDRCDMYTDRRFFEGIDDEMWIDELNEYGEPIGWDNERLTTFFEETEMPDTQHVARTWVVVLAYLLTDYRFIHL